MVDREKILKEAGYDRLTEKTFIKIEKGIGYGASIAPSGEIRLTCSDALSDNGEFLYDTGHLKINSAELIFLLNILNR